MPIKRIAIVSCGIGNIGSVSNALDTLEARYIVAEKTDHLQNAYGIILPGVGAFAEAMRRLSDSGFDDALCEEVLRKCKPFLGICIGMQVLAKDSTEGGLHDGLGWIDGHVLPLDAHHGLRIPHVGWNSVVPDSASRLFEGIKEESHFYFDHSYELTGTSSHVSSRFDYGGEHIAAVEERNVFAVQFHPEKSQRAGLRLLRNFLNICNRD